MYKSFYLAVILNLAISTLTGCSYQSVLKPFSYSSEHFKRQEEALLSWGYLVKKRSESVPTKWERDTFDLQNKNVIFVKSQNPVAGEANTYYRFTLTEEIYPDETQAKHRIENLFLKPPDFDEQDEYSFILRRAYQRGNFVYIIGTDVSMFEKEMQRLAKQLQEVLRNN